MVREEVKVLIPGLQGRLDPEVSVAGNVNDNENTDRLYFLFALWFCLCVCLFVTEYSICRETG